MAHTGLGEKPGMSCTLLVMLPWTRPREALQQQLVLSAEGRYFPRYFVSGLFHDLKHNDFVAFPKKFLLLCFVLTLVNNSIGLSHSPWPAKSFWLVFTVDVKAAISTLLSRGDGSTAVGMPEVRGSSCSQASSDGNRGTSWSSCLVPPSDCAGLLVS